MLRTWTLRSQLLPLVEQIRRHDRTRRQAAEGPGAGECPPKKVTGGGAAGAGCDPRGTPKKVVSALARGEVVRWMCARGLTERGRAMLTWAHAHTVTLRLIEPGKPNQNAYIELFKWTLP